MENNKRFIVERAHEYFAIYRVYDTIKCEEIDTGCKSAMEMLAKMLNKEG